MKWRRKPGNRTKKGKVKNNVLAIPLSPLANEDYKVAYGWYEDQQSGLGERFGKAVRQSCIK